MKLTSYELLLRDRYGLTSAQARYFAEILDARKHGDGSKLYPRHAARPLFTLRAYKLIEVKTMFELDARNIQRFSYLCRALRTDY